MSSYKVADGHDVALESLNDLVPQPSSRGLQITRRSYAANGTVHDQGKYVELNWQLLENASSYQALMTAFGLSAATTNAVTVYVRDQTFNYVRLNGTAVRPMPGEGVAWENYYPRNITILIRDLETAS